MNIFDLIDEVYISLKYSLKDITLIPSGRLVDITKVAVVLTAISLIEELFNIPAFLDWRGCIFGLLILIILTTIGRRK